MDYLTGLLHFYDCLEEAEESGLVVGLMERPRCNGKNKKVLVNKTNPKKSSKDLKIWVDELK